MGEEDVSRETSAEPDPRVMKDLSTRVDRVKSKLEKETEVSQNELDDLQTAAYKAQVELDEAWAKRRAAETEALTRQEARNYQETHATDEKAGISPAINEE